MPTRESPSPSTNAQGARAAGHPPPRWTVLSVPLVATFVAGGLMAGAPPAAADDRAARDGEESIVETPWVIGHRGAAAYRPEHTLASYRVAMRQRADVIEPDLVPTKDGHLVARHENLLDDTTDVADHPEFADRRTTKTIDGEEVTGWFSEDFTLAELKTLRAEERIPEIRPDNTRYDGKFEIPTFEEVVDLWEKRSGGSRGDLKLIPELKHGGYFDSIGLDTEKMLAKALREHDLAGDDAPVIVQSFEPPSLREMNERVDTPLVQLIDVDQGDLTTPEALDEISGYAEAIGPEMSHVLPIGDDGLPEDPTPLVADAHDRDLLVTPFTLRSENEFLPDGYDKGDDPTAYGDHESYYIEALRTGIDGAFADSPDHLYAAREKFLDGAS